MAIQFQRLATPGEGVSTLLDFAPLASAIDEGQRNRKAQLIGDAARTGGNTAAAQEAMKQGQLDTGAQYQRLAQQDTDRATQSKDRQIKMLGGVAQAAKFEKDPARRALLWQTGLKRAGINPADLDPDELDPMTGPDVFLAASGMAQDPRESQLMDLKLAQAQKDLSTSGPSSGLGLQPVFGRDAQGNLVVMQIGKDGKAVQTQLPPGVQVDLGARAGAQEMAKANAQAVVDLPKVENTSRRLIEQIEAVENDPRLSNVTGWQANLPTLDPRNVDVEERAAQLTGGAFLQAFESLKGGGQITEVEGAKATAALARLQNLRQSDEGYKTALSDFKREVEELVTLARKKAGGTSAQPTNTGAGSGPRAVNPQTGEQVEWNGSEWVPVQ